MAMPAVVFPEELRLSADGILAVLSEAISGLEDELFLLVQSREEDNIKYAFSSGCMPPNTTHTVHVYVLGLLGSGNVSKHPEDAESHAVVSRYLLPARRWVADRRAHEGDYVMQNIFSLTGDLLEQYRLYVGNENVCDAFEHEYGTLELGRPDILFSGPGYGPSFWDMALLLGLDDSLAWIPLWLRELVSKRRAECKEAITLPALLRCWGNWVVRRENRRVSASDDDRALLDLLADAVRLGMSDESLGISIGAASKQMAAVKRL